MRLYKHISVIAAVLLMSACNTSTPHGWRTEHYQDFCREIEDDIIQEFEKYLPLSYENSMMASIRYMPNYSALSLSGIDVLFQLDSAMFAENMNRLVKANLTPVMIFKDSTTFDKSNSEYYSVMFNNKKIAFPRIENDFCHEGDTCLTWTDLQIVVLEVGTNKAFKESLYPDYRPQSPTNNYSIGALFSKIELDIIYWLFIYE